MFVFAFSVCCVVDLLNLLAISISDPFRERPVNLKGGMGVWFSSKKISDSQCYWQKYSDFGGGKKNNLIQSFCHIT